MFEVVPVDGSDLNQLNGKTYCYCSFRNIVINFTFPRNSINQSDDYIPSFNDNGEIEK